MKRFIEPFGRRPFGFYFATALVAGACSFDEQVSWGARLALVAAAWWIPAVHELGHASLALALRMRVRRCWAVPGFGRTTLVTGGRRLEFGLVALAGPLTGVAAGLLVLAFTRDGVFGPMLGEAGRQALGWVALAGVLESALNLMPAHQLLDGKRAWMSLSAAWRERAPVRPVSEVRPAPAAWAGAGQGETAWGGAAGAARMWDAMSNVATTRMSRSWSARSCRPRRPSIIPPRAVSSRSLASALEVSAGA